MVAISPSALYSFGDVLSTPLISPSGIHRPTSRSITLDGEWMSSAFFIVSATLLAILCAVAITDSRPASSPAFSPAIADVPMS